MRGTPHRSQWSNVIVGYVSLTYSFYPTMYPLSQCLSPSIFMIILPYIYIIYIYTHVHCVPLYICTIYPLYIYTYIHTYIHRYIYIYTYCIPTRGPGCRYTREKFVLRSSMAFNALTNFAPPALRRRMVPWCTTNGNTGMF